MDRLDRVIIAVFMVITIYVFAQASELSKDNKTLLTRIATLERNVATLEQKIANNKHLLETNITIQKYLPSNRIGDTDEQ